MKYPPKNTINYNALNTVWSCFKTIILLVTLLLQCKPKFNLTKLQQWKPADDNGVNETDTPT